MRKGTGAIFFILCDSADTRNRPQLKQARRDSNPQHPDLESGALPFELLAYISQGSKLPQPGAQLIWFPYGADADDRSGSIS